MRVAVVMSLLGMISTDLVRHLVVVSLFLMVD